MKLKTRYKGYVLITYGKGKVVVNKNGSYIGMFKSLASACTFAGNHKVTMVTAKEYNLSK